MTGALLELTRAQVLAHRRLAGGLDRRLPPGPASLAVAASAGLQDSMPKAALLSIHARVEGSTPSTWEDPSLVQLWGPRFSAYAVAATDRALFTLGRLPEDPGGQRRALDLADRLDAFLDGRSMPYGEAGRALGEPPNRLRYAAPTGRVLIRWDGARQPTIWTVPAPDADPREARMELARRFLHVLGPATPVAFATWAGLKAARGPATFAGLGEELVPVHTPAGDAWILAGDEPAFRAPAGPAAVARLLPSGDAYYLLSGADRALLVDDPGDRARLWTTRVWPGALLVDGEIVGTWRRAHADVVLEAWHPLPPAARTAVEVEAASLPLPGIDGAVRVRWEG